MHLLALDWWRKHYSVYQLSSTGLVKETENIVLSAFLDWNIFFTNHRRCTRCRVSPPHILFTQLLVSTLKSFSLGIWWKRRVKWVKSQIKAHGWHSRSTILQCGAKPLVRWLPDQFWSRYGVYLHPFFLSVFFSLMLHDLSAVVAKPLLSHVRMLCH